MTRKSCYHDDISHAFAKVNISSENLLQEDAETKSVRYDPNKLVDAAETNLPMMFQKQFRRPIAMLSRESAVNAPKARTRRLRKSGGVS